MASKKIPTSPAPADKELEQRVQAMMERDAALPPVAPTDTATGVPPLDIFKDLKSAPEAPSELLEQVGAVPGVVEQTEAPKKVSITITDHDEQEPTTVTIQPDASAEAEPTPPAPEDVASTEPLDIPEAAIDDPTTDAAIDEITATEADQLLAIQDSVPQAPPAKEAIPKTKVTKPKTSRKRRLVLLGVALLLLLATALGVPASRYKIIGLVLKKPVTVTVYDTTTNTPVSSAVVAIDGQSAKTDGNGKATLKAAVGKRQIVITKQYYAASSRSTFVAIGATSPLRLGLVATGRQVPVKVVNKLTGQGLENTEIKVLNTSAKTDKNGQATIVLPTKTTTASGSLTLNGYNPATITIQITDSVVPANTYSLVPAGKVYFLSNESGTIDVMKSNLDGSDRQTVLKGTGKEDSASTMLVAARDWRYVALKAQRDSSQAALYFIDSTNNDKVVEFDSGDATFTPIGWSGHSFLYDVVRNSVSTAQNGHELLKSYDAERGQLNQLDQTQAVGTSTSYAYQGFYNFYVLGSLLVYNTQWYGSGGADLSAHNDSIRGVQTNGQNKKDYQTFAATGVGYIQAVRSKPQEAYYGVYDYLDTKTSYYAYKDQSVGSSTDLSAASFNKIYPAYLQSPSGKQVLWNESRDGKATIFVGDTNATGAHQLTNLTGYSAYGWSSDDYLLVSKNSSELYIVSTKTNASPSKLTDYYQPTQNAYSYGGF